MNIKTLLFATALIVCPSSGLWADEGLRLWDDAPAEEWMSAYPVGNGFMGAMIYGGVPEEHIQFNEESLETGTTEEMGSYQPFGDLYIDMQVGEVSEYCRSLSLDDAICRASYQSSGTHFYREVFASNPDGVIVIHYYADKQGALTGSIRLDSAHGCQTDYSIDSASFSGELENGMEYQAKIKVLNDGGQVSASDGCIKVAGCSSLTILLKAGTSFINDESLGFFGKDVSKEINRTLAKCSKKSYTKLQQNHLRDYQKLFGSFSIDLGSDDHGNMTTPKRLARYGEGKEDPWLEALACQFGRYLMIASSRDGSLPMNLQGVWNKEKKPAWYSQYTTNINIEMNYWGAESTGLGECHMPYFKWVENLAAVRKKSDDPKLQTDVAWKEYSTHNLMGGSSGWAVHLAGPAWLMQHFWWHYQYSGDRRFLKKRAYPMIKELAEFWLGHLVMEDGKYFTPDGWSPEHGPGFVEGDRTPYPGTSYDQEIVYDLFTNFISASETLDVDQALRERVINVRDSLLIPKIGRWGQLQEWKDDLDSPEDHHRHLSHLFAVYPGSQITLETTPELAAAAKVSLDARGSDAVGWSTAWRVGLYAHLHQAQQAYQFIRSYLTRSTAENLFSMYNSGSFSPFQIDANMGYMAGVVEMLAQSDGGAITILPALPDAWWTGEVKGVHARGGFVLDFSWRYGALEYLKVKSNLGGTCNLNLPDGTSLSFRTKKGKSYVLVDRPATLDFQKMINPAPESAKMEEADKFVWGGSMVKDDEGIYHLFYSRWDKAYGFESWVTDSEIAHATSPTPFGPFTFSDVALPPRGKEYWDGLCTHNPTIHKYDGKYYLYYMGNTGDGKHSPPNSLNYVSRNNQRIGVAVADSPDGPWTRFDSPLIDVSDDDGSLDALMASNPAITQCPDGSFLMVYKAVGKQRPLPFGGPVVHLVATSSSPVGPFEKHQDPVFQSDGVDFPAEDPFIWYQDDRYYAIVKDNNGYFTEKGRSLALFESTDGFDWKLSEHKLVYDLNLAWQSGEVSQMDNLERPQLFIENNRPVSLLMAACKRNLSGGIEHSFNVQVPLQKANN